MSTIASTRDQYLAIKVLEDFKEGRTISSGVCADLHQYPLIDRIREQAGIDSIDALLSCVGGGGGEQASLALAILRPHATTDRVRARVGAAWTAQSDYTARFPLVWLLLDDPELGAPVRASIQSFVRANLPRFLNDVRSYFAIPEEIVPGYRKRLTDPTFPQSKKWIYLISACASDNASAVRELLEEYVTDADAEMRATAQEMLERTFTNPPLG